MSTRGRRGRGGRRGGRGGYGKKKYVAKAVQQEVKREIRSALRQDSKSKPPPVSYARKGRPSPKVFFKHKKGKKVGNDKQISLEYHIKIAQHQFSAADVFSLNIDSTGVNCFGQFYLTPVNQFYFPACVYNMIRQYEFYRIRKVRLRYRCRVGTSTGSFIQCAYYADPQFFEAAGLASSAVIVQTAQLTSASSCGQWPAWQNMNCPWQYPGNTWLYTAGSALNATYPFGTVAPTERQTVAGVYGILGTTNPTPGSASIVGDWFMDLYIDAKCMQAVQIGTLSVVRDPVTGIEREVMENFAMKRKREAKEKLEQNLNRLGDVEKALAKLELMMGIKPFESKRRVSEDYEDIAPEALAAKLLTTTVKGQSDDWFTKPKEHAPRSDSRSSVRSK